MSIKPSKRRGILFLFFIGILPYEINGFFNPLLINHPLLYWISEILIWVCLPLTIYLVGVKKGFFTRADLGFHFDIYGKKKADSFFWGIFIMPFLCYWTYKNFYWMAIDIFPVNYLEVTFNYHQAIPNQGILKIAAVLFIALSAGFVEEFYCRGLFKLLFKPGRTNMVLYVFFSSLIFSSVHWEGGVRNLFATFAFGLLAATAYILIENIWPLVLGHLVTDFIVFS